MKTYNRIDINRAINLQCQKDAKMKAIDRLIDRLHDHPKTWMFFEDELTYGECRIMAEYEAFRKGK